MLLYQRVYNITKGDYHMLSFMEAQHQPDFFKAMAIDIWSTLRSPLRI